MSNNQINAVILAGGSGSRLWPTIEAKGVLIVTREAHAKGDEIITAHKNQSTYIPIGAKHRLENRGNEPSHIAGTQVGDYLSEDNILRNDDN